MPIQNKTHLREISMMTSHSLAERIFARRVAREDFLHAHKLKKTGRIPIVGIVTASTDSALFNELKEACSHLTPYLFEISDFTETELDVYDLIVFLTNDLVCGRLAIMALAHGAVPVLSEKIAPKLFTHEYDPIEESGNSFFFYETNKWEIFAAVVRALETFRFSYDWQGIVRNALETSK